jgi:hypothetical protein
MGMHPEFSKRLVLLQLAEAQQQAGLFDKNVILEEVTYPHLYIRFRNIHGHTRLLHFECTDYDLRGMAIGPVHPLSRSSLNASEWMLRRDPQAGRQIFPTHPLLQNAPFLCFEGNREYFQHPSHLPVLGGKRWEAWRSQMRLAAIIGFIKDRLSTGVWE